MLQPGSTGEDGHHIPVLVKRLRSQKEQHDPKDARLIYGYSACLDVAVDAREYIPVLLEHFGITNPQPKFHSKLENELDFIESFLFYFQQGANAEQRVC